MKALSVRQPWAQWIAIGEKTVEVRSRQTHHRGPLAICSSAQPDVDFLDEVQEYDLPLGQVVCVVDVVDCVPMTEEHFDAAYFLWDDWRVLPERGAWAWVLAGVRLVEPLPKKGKLSPWDVDDGEIRYMYECPACRDPHRDLVAVYQDDEEKADAADGKDADVPPEVEYLMCESCGAEFHELTRDEHGYIRILGEQTG